MLLANGQLAEQGLAEVEPLVSTGYYYPESLGLQLERQFALYGEIYKKQPWVRAVIDKRAAALARLPVQCWYTSPDTEVLETTTGYAKLLADPCDYLSPFEFWQWVWTTVDIYGETYLAIQKSDKGLPEKLLPMHPSRVTVKRDSKSSRYIYYFMAGGGINSQLVHFSQDEVVPFRLFNPRGLERGLSRMESLKETLFAEDASRNATSSMWRNAGRPNLVLQHQKQLSKEAQDRLKAQFENAHAGSSNAGKTLVAEEGMTVQPVQLTAVEMQHIESRQLNRQEICGVYDTAETMVHIEDHSTFANIASQMRAFYRDSMAVPIAFVESVMDKWVGQYWPRKNTMRFGIEDVIRGDWEERAQSGQHAVTSAGMTPNEFRQLLGQTRLEDPLADKLYANAAMQPLGMPAEQIRIQGELNGTTPDGIQVTPQQTPVASLTGAEPRTITALPPRRSSAPESSPQPSNRHYRAIRGAMGRKQDIRAFARQLAEKYPDDLDSILEAVHLAIQSTKEN